MKLRGEMEKVQGLLLARAWAIWLVRNDWVFNNRLLRNAVSIPHKALSFLFGAHEVKGRDGESARIVACQYPRDRRFKQMMPST
uniref:Uncharacterized protein n=1 Tax=Oryza meridionalis TaxID=40149 RepID=A0A0E0EJE5_9ORYZ